MSGSQFQQFNEDLNKMLGSTLTVSTVFVLFFFLKSITSILGHVVQAIIRFTVLSQALTLFGSSLRAGYVHFADYGCFLKTGGCNQGSRC